MSAKTGIEWTEATWNPVVGCEHVSAGCDHCYAAREASGRLSHLPAYAGLARGGKFTGEVRLLPDRLSQPLRWKRPRRIFVNSMSDLFHKDVPDEYIARVFAVMAQAKQHTFQILTKRHARMRSFLQDDCRCGSGHVPGVHLRSAMGWAGTSHSPTFVPGVTGREVYHERAWPLPNVFLGVSAENQPWADIRIPALFGTPAAVRWVSAEPLLGPIDLRNVAGVNAVERDWCGSPAGGTGAPHPLLDWVVAGGESGAAARPMHPDWARSLRDQCARAAVPFLFKQWGEWGPMAPTDNKGRFIFDGAHPLADDGTLYAPSDLAYPDGPRYREAIRAGHDKANLTHVYRVGKKASGRELDGKVWDEYPAPTREPAGH